MQFDGEILFDHSRLGRVRPWKTHKINSLLLADSFKRLKRDRKSEAVCQCGSFLEFRACPSGHEKRLFWANFCRVRLCPMCSWRRSMLVAHQVKQVAHEAVKREKMRWLFLTLTVKNVTGDSLIDAITNLMTAWDKFAKRKVFKKIVIGWFRAFEVTRNLEDGTYHPHFHVLLGVPPSYFKSRDYMSHEQWVSLWADCLKVDYIPVVDVRAVKDKSRNVQREIELLRSKGIEVSPAGELIEGELPGSAVAEMAKYATKSNDFIVYNHYKEKNRGNKVTFEPILESGINEEVTDQAVAVLDDALARRRLLAYGGLLKEVWNELNESGKIQDVESENVDLVHVDDESNCACSVCGSNMLEEMYQWIPYVANYIKKEKHSSEMLSSN